MITTGSPHFWFLASDEIFTPYRLSQEEGDSRETGQGRKASASAGEN